MNWQPGPVSSFRDVLPDLLLRKSRSFRCPCTSEVLVRRTAAANRWQQASPKLPRSPFGYRSATGLLRSEPTGGSLSAAAATRSPRRQGRPGSTTSRLTPGSIRAERVAV